MPSCIFDKCCGCIELKTGCLVIGYLNLISQLVFLILGVVGLITGGLVASKHDSNQEEAAAIIVSSVIILIVVLFLFAFTVVLLVGVHQNKRGHVKVYLIVTGILLCLGLIATVCSLVTEFDLTDLVSKIVSFAFNIYYLLVIRSYYYKMDDKRPPMYNAAQYFPNSQHV